LSCFTTAGRSIVENKKKVQLAAKVTNSEVLSAVNVTTAIFQDVISYTRAMTFLQNISELCLGYTSLQIPVDSTLHLVNRRVILN
jgi:hypothetical protein